MIKSGWVYSYGMGFWGPNGHDGIWHIALAGSLARGTMEMPVFAGEAITNYHIGFDLLLGLLHKVTGISLCILYFQILPPLMALVIGLLTYFFVYNWRNSENEALWAVFFTYFAGSFGWLIGKGESAFWSQQAVTSLINPPYALSLIFILSGLIFLINYQKTRNILFLLLRYTITLFVALVKSFYLPAHLLHPIFLFVLWAEV